MSTMVKSVNITFVPYYRGLNQLNTKNYRGFPSETD